jgi:hypothetical protein
LHRDKDSDAQNKEIKTWGTKPNFTFPAKDHVELMTNLKMVDFERGAKVHGFRGYFLTGEGARLSFAIWNYAMDFFSKKNFTPIIPPVIVRKVNLYGTGHLRSGRCDALLVAAADVKWGQLDTSGLEVLAFDPGELVPAPGQGVLAWQCLRDDMATRLLLQKIHHSAVATATNVERQALRLLECHSLNSAGIHCRRDVQGHYHVSAACQKGDTLQRTRLSSCTHMGLAEAVAAALEI